MKLNIQDTFNKELAADKNKNNTRRQVLDACFSFVSPKTPNDPKVIHVSADMLDALGISQADSQSEKFKGIFSGSEIMEGSYPYSMCYGGHQFGHWAGQLGDGRAINLMEVTHKEKRWALQLKGAGETPYSRSADGLAVLRSSIREHLCSEAMFHLGVPTTRSLSLSLSGDQVYRDMMYDGNGAFEKGAIVCRVAPSFIRFGNFQIFTSRGDAKNLKALTDYTIKYFFPEIESINGAKKYLDFFELVSQKTLDMIIDWQRVGFVHGVMNTDNMSILGLTIDYGPYGWLEGYDKGWTPNTTDRQHARYRYGNQGGVALWNLYQLANALVPLVEKTEDLDTLLNTFRVNYLSRYQKMMLSKLGLQVEIEKDQELVIDLENNLALIETDMTIFFRLLSKVSKSDSPSEAFQKLTSALYDPKALTTEIETTWISWISSYLERLKEEKDNDVQRAQQMNTVNPKYVLRNYMAQLAIDQANKGDYSLIDELYQLLKQPYAEQPENEKWFVKRPEWARHKVGCSMLSCSS